MENFLDLFRQWLIERGYPADQLDQLVESPVQREIGETLVMLLQRVEELEQKQSLILVKVGL